MLLLVVEAELDQAAVGLGSRSPSSSARHRLVDVARGTRPISATPGRETQAPVGPRVPGADPLVVGVEQVGVGGVEGLVAVELGGRGGRSRRTRTCGPGATWSGSRRASTGRSGPRRTGERPAPRSASGWRRTDRSACDLRRSSRDRPCPLLPVMPCFRHDSPIGSDRRQVRTYPDLPRKRSASRRWESNPRPDDYKSSALPTAPHRPGAGAARCRRHVYGFPTAASGFGTCEHGVDLRRPGEPKRLLLSPPGWQAGTQWPTHPEPDGRPPAGHGRGRPAGFPIAPRTRRARRLRGRHGARARQGASHPTTPSVAAATDYAARRPRRPPPPRTRARRRPPPPIRRARYRCWWPTPRV